MREGRGEAKTERGGPELERVTHLQDKVNDDAHDLRYGDQDTCEHRTVEI